LLGGLNYPNQPLQLAVNAGAVVHGTPGAPVTIPSLAGGVALAVGDGATLRDVRVLHTGGTGQVTVPLGAGAVGERLYVDAGATNEYACSLANGALLRDSVCSNDNGDAVLASAQGGEQSTVTLRNVTAIAPSRSGIRAQAVSPSSQLTVHATNVIVQGDDGNEKDVFASTDGSFAATSVVSLSHSNYDTTDIDHDGSVTPPPDDPGPDANGNVTTPPVFVNPGSGNFNQQAGSAGTIDLGTSNAVNLFGLGALDLDGGPRCTGAAPDIGADELNGSACATPATPTPPTPPRKKCKKGRKLKKGKCVKKKRKKRNRS
jgi:hypothetical protein